MKSILSLLSILAILTTTVLAEDQAECNCACDKEEFLKFTEEAVELKKKLDDCEFKVEKMQKMLDIHQEDNKNISEDMASLTDFNAAKARRRRDPEGWADEKQNLIEDLNDKEEELYSMIRRYDKREKDLKKTVKELKNRILQLKKKDL